MSVLDLLGNIGKKRDAPRGILQHLQATQARPQPGLQVAAPQGLRADQGIPGARTMAPQLPGWGNQVQNPGGDYQLQPQQPYNQQQEQVGVSYNDLNYLAPRNKPQPYIGANGIQYINPYENTKGIGRYTQMAVPMQQPNYPTYTKLRRI